MIDRTEVVKFRVGRYRYPAELIYQGNRIFIKVPYNEKLIKEIKVMSGARWHGYDEVRPIKMWSVTNNSRNRFQIKYLTEQNPYARYDLPLIEAKPTRKEAYEHQVMQFRHIVTRRQCIVASEMGTGKSFSAIEVMEYFNLQDDDVWYVGPRSGVKAFQLELWKWGCKIKPKMFTYERLTRFMNDWVDTVQIPQMVIFDESSRVKTPSSQRSEAALKLANLMRDEYGDDAIILEMSGTPAPKAPTDWWHQTEIACPGFIREGDVNKFKARMCLIEMRDNNITGGSYPHVITWLDDACKCVKCGQLESDAIHSQIAIVGGEGHPWEKSINEVEYLYKRLKGLVLVQFKKDCLDLPEKRYELITIRPTAEILRAAKLITKTTTRAIQALTLIRELSDGFQYTEVARDTTQCPNCLGVGHTVIKVPKQPVDGMKPLDIKPEDFEDKDVVCDNCAGSGQIPRYERQTDAVGSPKDEYFKEDLENHEEAGRYIVWGGFTGTVDRLVAMALAAGWDVLRVDGRGYHGFAAQGGGLNSDELLAAMDRTHPKAAELLEKYPRLCFVGHPQAGGMALTLHASPTELFYSNCFNGEARMQAEDRAHRMGMDDNRGLTIKDLIMLPTDKLVLDNLRQKKKLQDLSMGELKDAFAKE